MTEMMKIIERIVQGVKPITIQTDCGSTMILAAIQ
jgi:hypothetical protein